MLRENDLPISNRRLDLGSKRDVSPFRLCIEKAILEPCVTDLLVLAPLNQIHPQDITSLVPVLLSKSMSREGYTSNVPQPREGESSNY
jgi:hypothetical protein